MTPVDLVFFPESFPVKDGLLLFLYIASANVVLTVGDVYMWHLGEPHVDENR